MRIYIDIQIFNFAFVSLNCIDQQRLEDIAGATPWSTSLNHNWSLTVLQSVLPITIWLHLLDVSWLVWGILASCSVWRSGSTFTAWASIIREGLLWVYEESWSARICRLSCHCHHHPLWLVFLENGCALYLSHRCLYLGRLSTTAILDKPLKHSLEHHFWL